MLTGMLAFLESKYRFFSGGADAYCFQTQGTSDLIETMNETIKYDIIKPTNKGGEKK